MDYDGLQDPAASECLTAERDAYDCSSMNYAKYGRGPIWDNDGYHNPKIQTSELIYQSYCFHHRSQSCGQKP
jgi:hypothetical protein